MKQSSLQKQMAQYFYWGLSLLGAEFVRDRDVPESYSLLSFEELLRRIIDESFLFFVHTPDQILLKQSDITFTGIFCKSNSLKRSY